MMFVGGRGREGDGEGGGRVCVCVGGVRWVTPKHEELSA